jgi:hypothetical protein
MNPRAVKECLTSTTKGRTLYDVFRTVRQVDATAKKLIEKNADLQRQIADLQRQSNALTAALEAIGMRIADDDPFNQPSDGLYAETRPFSHTSLVAACKRILTDHRDKALTKSHVEYLAAIGGYPFATDDSKNSVDVTLRRLADQGFCTVARSPAGNQYRLSLKDEEE